MSVLLSVENPEKRALFKGVFDRAKAIFAPDNFPEHEVQKILQELAAADEFLKKGGEWLESYKIGRRPLLKVIGMSAAGLALATSIPSFVLPPQARAQDEWIDVGLDPGDLNQRQWFPFDAALARDKGLVKMHDVGGSLDIHDEILGHHGPRGHAREWAQEFAYVSLRRFPSRRSWMGYCHAVGNLMAYHEPLVIGRGETFLYEGVEIDLTSIIGLYAAKHAHDFELAVRSDQADIPALLAAAIAKGWAPVANIPGDGRRGQVWSYVVTKIRADRGAVEAQNFGQIIQSPISAIAGIYFPFAYNPNDPEIFRNEDPKVRKIRERTLGYFNPELNHIVVDSITQNQPLG